MPGLEKSHFFPLRSLVQDLVESLTLSPWTWWGVFWKDFEHLSLRGLKWVSKET